MTQAASSVIGNVEDPWFPCCRLDLFDMTGEYLSSWRGGQTRVRAALFALMVCASGSVGGDDVARGEYLIEALTACDNCHTPRGPDGYDLSRRFSGGSQLFSDREYAVRGRTSRRKG
ncbi:hypothetical protein SAMN05444581_11211 [Methylocapsa palsarum]|uniref:Uncharacterized protein n=1 Tax=Methylocapsa palsarum TaxID=1612308 RepID=A0A1I4AW86_9HYPH|nr:hypothetical protein SAMN05444581_11211 [Methylocapsa palsarum]